MTIRHLAHIARELSRPFTLASRDGAVHRRPGSVTDYSTEPAAKVLICRWNEAEHVSFAQQIARVVTRRFCSDALLYAEELGATRQLALAPCDTHFADRDLSAVCERACHHVGIGLAFSSFSRESPKSTNRPASIPSTRWCRGFGVETAVSGRTMQHKTVASRRAGNQI